MDEGALRGLPTGGPTATVAADLQNGQEIENIGGRLWDTVAEEWIRAPANVSYQPAPGLELGERTATDTSSPIANYGWRYLQINLHITKGPEDETKKLGVSVIDPIHTIVLFAGVHNDDEFQMGPGLAMLRGGGAAETEPKVQAQTANALVPGKFTIRVTPSDASAWTYEVRYSLFI